MGVGVAAAIVLVPTVWLLVDPRGSGAAVENSPRPTSASASDESAPTFDLAHEVLSEDGAVVSILTDSTGNDPGEWPDLWAQHLGNDHRVTLNQWGPEGWLPPITYGDDGPEIAIWNYAIPGSTATMAAENIRDAVPVKPDLVIYSYGHNDTASVAVLKSDEVATNLEAAHYALYQRWGAVDAQVVVAQNPALGEYAELGARTRQLVADWAEGAGYPLVDVASAFKRAGADKLTVDEYHPNADGERVWAGVVIDALE